MKLTKSASSSMANTLGWIQISNLCLLEKAKVKDSRPICHCHRSTTKSRTEFAKLLILKIRCFTMDGNAFTTGSACREFVMKRPAFVRGGWKESLVLPM